MVIKWIENNMYPTTSYKRIEMKDVKEAKTFHYFSNGIDTGFEVLIHFGKDINRGASGRIYKEETIPKKYKKVYEQMKEEFESKKDL